jgi:hypothetical protein
MRRLHRAGAVHSIDDWRKLQLGHRLHLLTAVTVSEHATAQDCLGGGPCLRPLTATATPAPSLRADADVRAPQKMVLSATTCCARRMARPPRDFSLVLLLALVGNLRFDTHAAGTSARSFELVLGQHHQGIIVAQGPALMLCASCTTRTSVKRSGAEPMQQGACTCMIATRIWLEPRRLLLCASDVCSAPGGPSSTF